MEPREQLAQGMEFARAGDQKQAKELIAKAVKADPSLKQGWWELARLLDDKDRQLDCLKQVLKLDPADAEARAKLEELQGAPSPGEPAPHVPPTSGSQDPPGPRVSRGRNRYVTVAVVVVILVGALFTWLVASGALQGLFGGGARRVGKPARSHAARCLDSNTRNHGARTNGFPYRYRYRGETTEFSNRHKYAVTLPDTRSTLYGDHHPHLQSPSGRDNDPFLS